MKLFLRNKWLKVVGLFLLGIVLIGSGMFLAAVAHLVLIGLGSSVVNHTIFLETAPFYGSGAISIVASILTGIFATSE